MKKTAQLNYKWCTVPTKTYRQARISLYCPSWVAAFSTASPGTKSPKPEKYKNWTQNFWSVNLGIKLWSPDLQIHLIQLWYPVLTPKITLNLGIKRHWSSNLKVPRWISRFTISTQKFRSLHSYYLKIYNEGRKATLSHLIPIHKWSHKMNLRHHAYPEGFRPTHVVSSGKMLKCIPIFVRVITEKYTYGSSSNKWEVYLW